jgi:plasmid stabilization system protein ParE
MSGFRIIITATAREQLREIAHWWRENMRDEPELFIHELEASLQRLAALPWSGSPYPIARPTDVRRTLLRRCQYHLYYTIDEQARTVTIRASWHTARGHGPPLT